MKLLTYIVACSAFYIIGVTIGLQRIIYSVSEDDDVIEVCAVLVSGTLERSVNVTVSSVDGSALGRMELPAMLLYA